MSLSHYGLQTVTEREAVLLAPYAMHSADTRGRRYPESEHPYRSVYQRDRDRIIHSTAFRRLSGKMQVFTGDMGDYHRTRLTHTFEVSSIARTIGRTLRLNEDLIEALALFHDIGHPPFGHAGEDALDECLADAGGFSHNQFALTLAEELELRYPSFPGLNLSREVLDGQGLRATKEHGELTNSPDDGAPLMEAQVVDLADSVTYDSHDCDDAVKLGLVSLAELCEVPLVREAAARVRSRYGELDELLLRPTIVHELIDTQVSDLLRYSAPRLLAENFPSAATARAAGFRLTVSDELAEKKRELERFLYARVYRHQRLIEVRGLAQRRLRELHDAYQQQPNLLPPKFFNRIPNVGLPRAAGEFLAGMTDRYFEMQYRNVFP